MSVCTIFTPWEQEIQHHGQDQTLACAHHTASKLIYNLSNKPLEAFLCMVAMNEDVMVQPVGYLILYAGPE